ncbi:ribulose-phosphate 3-epimerase [Pullulanibacillus sp. KACC 23026]|uniref:ribulose-phosphate 3-epimerase n=1 Tax=Pullulanibacillus sp. KACC 23026 TaxID=3028315 RepID=UPI0023B174B7|nr:ribulose-phosphate 3-epimerase [Pullulanibacillus sp. KACC 23026]WEG11012.1 ribulose-phosphate 3-epimerase [Pullulanibacillus sp. KACC 23026]
MALVLASILDADWDHLPKEIQDVDQAGVDAFSIDIMDGDFVERTTFSPETVSQIRNITKLPIEVHLMVSRPEDHVEKYCDAGADQVVFHLEATKDPLSLINYIKSRGLLSGVAILKETDLSQLSDEVLEAIDAITLMSITIGFGGQKPSPETIDRIKALRERANQVNPNLAIVIDGGMKPNNASIYTEAGADGVVIGTGIYHADNYEEAIQLAKKAIHSEDPVSRRRFKEFLETPSLK